MVAEKHRHLDEDLDLTRLYRLLGSALRGGRATVERLIQEAMNHGQICADRDPAIETDLILALSGFAPLIELNVIEPLAALAAIDQHLDRLFSPAP